jgi:2,4-dienoyl-CoA reductase-like NADH-dependent reductase (Old Yellow Enzyme family)
MSRYPHVELPLTINGCELRNRILRASHGTGLASHSGMAVGEPLIAYHEARARGGAALTILDSGAVHPSTYGGLFAYLDANLEGWAKLGERCRAEGMKVFQQIFHGGSTQGRDPFTGAPAWSPSGGASPGVPAPAVAMSKGMIDEIVASHIETAARCQQAGLDGVELHAAHGYLLHEFLSPLTNHRTDDYGGPLENRMRLTLEILRGLRARLGRGYPLGVRLSGSEWQEGGLSSEDMMTVAKRLEAEDLIDFLDVSSGSYFTPHKIIAAMHEAPGYELPTSTLLTRAVKVPTFVNGRFTTLGEAEAVLESSAADMVSLVRAMVAEPELVSKSLAGREAEVRPCIGCNQECIGGVQGPRRVIGCVVNVEAGKEWSATPVGKAEQKRRVLVVGGGPAGLEAARTAALRGHTVTVHETADEAGGNIRFARRAPFRADIGRIIDYQIDELRRLGVELRLDSKADLDVIRGEGAVHVILAAGAEPSHDGRQRLRQLPVPGVELPHVRSLQEVMGAPAPRGAKALVLDDLGTYPAIGVAEHLLAGGAQVTLASSLPAVGSELALSLVQRPSAERLGAYVGYAFVGLQTVAEITPTHVRLREVGNHRERLVEADLVVLCVAGSPRRELHEALVRDGIPTSLVGDAVAPADLGTAIRSGHLAALAI